MHRSRWTTLALIPLASLLLVGCAPISSLTVGMGNGHSVHSQKSHAHGPPPHAPAHGYRHKHEHKGQDLELAFDSGLGFYAVLGIPNRFYWNGYYLRIDGDQWYASTELDGRWEAWDDDALPKGKAKKESKHKGQAKGKGKGKHGHKDGSKPAKGKW
jgi:hypothetical protein